MLTIILMSLIPAAIGTAIVFSASRAAVMIMEYIDRRGKKKVM